MIGLLDDAARRAIRTLDLALLDDAPVADGAIELRRWVREQAISRTRHRHGRLLGPLVAS